MSRCVGYIPSEKFLIFHLPSLRDIVSPQYSSKYHKLLDLIDNYHGGDLIDYIR